MEQSREQVNARDQALREGLFPDAQKEEKKETLPTPKSNNNKVGLWRYRVEKFRIICQIIDKQLCILVVKIGKRDKVYED